MFSFFKRSDKTSDAVASRPRTPERRTHRNNFLDSREPLPLPQVTEGNEDSDWAMWEDSVMELDSQMQGQTHGGFHDTVPGDFPIAQQADATGPQDAALRTGKGAN